MKIRILTTYAVYNYGASLQAYALTAYLAGKGHDAALINYQPAYLTRKYDYRWVNPESPLSRYALTRALYRVMKYVQRQTTLRRKRAFDRFTQAHLPQTPQRYTTYAELRQQPPEADLYLAGSDQIWNVFYDAGRDPAFYLQFGRPDVRKASYAASFSYLDIDEENLGRIGQALQDFTAISVREWQGVDLIERMGLQATWVLDPVFLLPAAAWQRLMNLSRPQERYLLVYDFERNAALKHFAQAYARRHGLRIYSINDTYPLPYAHRNYNGAGPQEFLSLLYHCSAFVSNSFHGTAFSILFHKPVFVFPRHRHKVNSRMESLLHLFQMDDCIIHTPAQAEAALTRPFDFEATERILTRERQKSENFIAALLS